MAVLLEPLEQPQPANRTSQEVHLHLHGVTAEDIAAIVAQRRLSSDGFRRLIRAAVGMPEPVALRDTGSSTDQVAAS